MQTVGNAILVCWAQQAHNTRRLLSLVGNLWCRVMHDDITWPFRSHYSCRRCGRHYPVPWGNRQEATV
jgi:hypothetical protein